MIITLPLQAVAQETEEAIVLDVDGVEGIWMPTAMSQRVRLDAALVPHLRLKIEKLETKLDIRQERLESAKESFATAEKAKNQAILATKEAMNHSTSLEKELDAWYRKPGFLIGVGVVGLLIVEGVVIFGLSSAAN